MVSRARTANQEKAVVNGEDEKEKLRHGGDQLRRKR